MTGPPPQPRSPRTRSRWPQALTAAAIWAMAVPYVAPLVGVRLDVPAGVEVIDHVVPGGFALAAALTLLVGEEAVPGDRRWSVAAAVTFLAGFWMISTHAPLLAEAARGISAWDAALVHTTAGLPLAGIGGWMLLRPLLGSG